MGHVVKTAAGSYRANWRDVAGRQRSKTFGTKKEANAYLADVETSTNHGTYVDPHAGRLPFGQYAERWLNGRSLGLRAKERVRSVLRTHVMPRWQNIPLGKVDHLAVQTWVGELGRTLAPGTVAKVHGVLSQIMRSAVRSRLISHDPTEGVTRPSSYRRNAELTTISRDAFFEQLLPAVPPEHRGLVCVAGGTGLRWGEVVGLPWSAVDLEKRVLRVVQVAVETSGAVSIKPYPKSRAGIRSVPLPSPVVEALKHQTKTWPLVFATRTGTPPRRSNFRRQVWQPSLARAGIKGLRFHDLRHSYATWLVSDGVPINVVQRVMGHENASTTLNLYTHTPSDYDSRIRSTFADFPLTPDPRESTEEEDEGGDQPDDQREE